MLGDVCRGRSPHTCSSTPERARRAQLGLSPETQGQNLALTVLYVLSSLDGRSLQKSQQRENLDWTYDVGP